MDCFWANRHLSLWNSDLLCNEKVINVEVQHAHPPQNSLASSKTTTASIITNSNRHLQLFFPLDNLFTCQYTIKYNSSTYSVTVANILIGQLLGTKSRRNKGPRAAYSFRHRLPAEFSSCSTVVQSSEAYIEESTVTEVNKLPAGEKQCMRQKLFMEFPLGCHLVHYARVTAIDCPQTC